MAELDPTAGPYHPSKQIAAWLHTLAILHEEHKRSPSKLAQIEAYQEQAEDWLRMRIQPVRPAEQHQQERIQNPAPTGKAKARRPSIIPSQPTKP